MLSKHKQINSKVQQTETLRILVFPVRGYDYIKPKIISNYDQEISTKHPYVHCIGLNGVVYEYLLQYSTWKRIKTTGFPPTSLFGHTASYIQGNHNILENSFQ